MPLILTSNPDVIPDAITVVLLPNRTQIDAIAAEYRAAAEPDSIPFDSLDEDNKASWRATVRAVLEAARAHVTNGGAVIGGDM